MADLSDAVLVVGFTCRSLAQCANGQGFSPLVIDRCGDRDTRKAAKMHSLWLSDEDITDEAIDDFLNNRPSGLDAKSCFPQFCVLAGGTENNLHLIARLSRMFPNMMNPAQYLSMRCWKNWRNWSENSGMLFPWSWELGPILSEPDDLPRTPTDSASDNAYLFKRLDQAGGLGITAWNREESPLASPLALASSNGIVQERIDGQSVGVTFLSSTRDGIALGCTEAWPAQPHPWGPFVYHGSVGPVSLPEEDWQLLDAFAKNVTDASHWKGLWQADFIRRGSQWYLLEINPRWTASMELLEASTGLELVRLHSLAVSGKLANDAWQKLLQNSQSSRIASSRCFAKRVVYAPRSIEVSEAMIERWWHHRLPLESFTNGSDTSSGCWFADIPNEPMQFETGYPVCSIIGVSASTEDLKIAMEERHRLEIEYLSSSDSPE
ncbi:MAG: ATP-grasp domain-containing protein [Pirellula sp.]|jgi:predicted ATP-grasp superfamily ATP-dependent carboligase|nr:ATP-grasp domain-containing protein [Pirellula sp.]